MPEYIVTWQIPIVADDPFDAARQALEIMQDPASIATCFRVEHDTQGAWMIDVADPDKPILLDHEWGLNMEEVTTRSFDKVEEGGD